MGATNTDDKLLLSESFFSEGLSSFVLTSFLTGSILFLFVFFLIIILYWRVFLWNPIRNFLQSTFSQWGNLSEGWQIFTLSIPVLIISTVLSNILSHLVINKFKKDIS